jgi:hypothetical protein
MNPSPPVFMTGRQIIASKFGKNSRDSANVEKDQVRCHNQVSYRQRRDHFEFD